MGTSTTNAHNPRGGGAAAKRLWSLGAIATVVLCCCGAMMTIGSREVHAEAEVDVKPEVAEEFWQKFLNPTYPGTTDVFTDDEKEELKTFSNNKLGEQFLRAGAIGGAAAGGGLLALVAPFLHLKGKHSELERNVLSSQGSSMQQVSNVGEEEAQKARKALFRKPGWEFKASKAGAALGIGLLLAAAGMFVGSRLYKKKIRDQKERIRRSLAWDDDGFSNYTDEEEKEESLDLTTPELIAEASQPVEKAVNSADAEDSSVTASAETTAGDETSGDEKKME